MKFFLPIACLLGFSRNVLGQRIQQGANPYGDGVSYQDLIDINASCYPFDSCEATYRENDPPDVYKCSCGKQCWEIGTCCIDSPFRHKPAIQECRSTGTSKEIGYYMIHRCPDSTLTDSIWKYQCEKEWNGEDDILVISPVTSVDTSRTYTNYYCFRCHERTDNYVSWNLFVESNHNVSGEISVYSVTYNQAQKTWVANLDKDHIAIPVNLSFLFPYNVQIERAYCDIKMIVDCPDTWTDRRVHDQCLAYTAVVYREFSSYKNVHCALCNDVPLDELTCNQTHVGGRGSLGDFSFKTLININDSGGDKAGNEGKCDEDQLWDPYGKICRKISCALPEHVIKDGKCVSP